MPSELVTSGPTLVACVSLISTTAAPGTTAPCESVTVPDMLPVVICAAAGTAEARHSIKAAASALTHFLGIHPPSHRLTSEAGSSVEHLHACRSVTRT